MRAGATTHACGSDDSCVRERRLTRAGATTQRRWGWLGSRRDQASDDAEYEPGAAHRAGRPGVHGTAQRTALEAADDAHAQPHRRAHRGAPGRLGERAAAGALHAALLPDGLLRRRPAGACADVVGLAAAPAAGRVLGARPSADARRAVAGDAPP